jgi:general secretion pathway protein G
MLRILLIVVAFLMLVGLAAYFVAARTQESAKVAVAQVQARTLRTAVDTYTVKNGEPPASLEVLLQADPKTGGPYLKAAALIEPWGNLFQYAPEGIKGKTTSPAIWTTTPDKVMIGNWAEPKK